jgi:hypothetical protein
MAFEGQIFANSTICADLALILRFDLLFSGWNFDWEVSSMSSLKSHVGDTVAGMPPGLIVWHLGIFQKLFRQVDPAACE